MDGDAKAWGLGPGIRADVTSSAGHRAPGAPERARSARERRDASARAAGVGGAGLRVVSILGSLATVPLAISLLGAPGYGAWVAVMSVGTWLSALDLGLGAAMTNRMSAAQAIGDRTSVRRAISTATCLSFLPAGVVGTAVLASSKGGGAADALGIPSHAAGAMIAVLGVVIVPGMVLQTAARAYVGFQEGAVLSVFQAVSPLLQWALLWGVSRTSLGTSVYAALWSLAAPPLIVSFAALGFMFVRRRPWAAPRWTSVGREEAWSLLRPGFYFMFLQIIALITWETGALVSLQVLGPSAVATLVVAARLTQLPQSLLGGWLAQLWPAYADAVACGDWPWARRRHLRSSAFAASLSLLTGLVVVPGGGWFVDVWTQGRVSVGTSLLIPLSVLGGVQLWCQVQAAALNGLGAVRIQLVWGLSAGLFGLMLAFLLGRRFGLPGIPWATAVAMFPAAVHLFLVVRRRLRPPREASCDRTLL